MTLKLNTDNGLQRRAVRSPAANSVLPQLVLTCKIEAECAEIANCGNTQNVFH